MGKKQSLELAGGVVMVTGLAVASFGSFGQIVVGLGLVGFSLYLFMQSTQ